MLKEMLAKKIKLTPYQKAVKKYFESMKFIESLHRDFIDDANERKQIYYYNELEKLKIDKSLEKLLEKFSIDNFTMETSYIYEKYFSIDELKKITKFFKSDVGKKHIESSFNFTKEIQSKTSEMIDSVINQEL